MGAAAYHRCDLVLKRWFADAFGPVFQELSRKFQESVAVLESVRRHAGPDDLARAYERWLLASEGIPSDDAGASRILLIGD